MLGVVKFSVHPFKNFKHSRLPLLADTYTHNRHIIFEWVKDAFYEAYSLLCLVFLSLLHHRLAFVGMSSGYLSTRNILIIITWTTMIIWIWYVIQGVLPCDVCADNSTPQSTISFKQSRFPLKAAWCTHDNQKFATHKKDRSILGVQPSFVGIDKSASLSTKNFTQSTWFFSAAK